MRAYPVKQFAAALFVTVTLAFLLVGVARSGASIYQPQSASPSMTNAPTSPMSIQLSISTPPALNQMADVRALVQSSVEAPNTKAEIVLSEGFILVNGVLSWTGDLAKGGHVELLATVKAIKTGEWTIEARAISNFTRDSYFGSSAALRLLVSESFGEIVKQTTTTTSPGAAGTTSPPSGEEINQTNGRQTPGDQRTAFLTTVQQTFSESWLIFSVLAASVSLFPFLCIVALRQQKKVSLKYAARRPNTDIVENFDESDQ